MKLEFLAGGTPNCPLLRLFSFTSEGARDQRNLLYDLSSGTVKRLSLHKQPGIQSIDHCELDLCLGQKDKGVRQVSAATFECVLAPLSWDNMAGLVEPFCQANSTGYQWLCEKSGIKPLLTHDGRW